ncbi:MAG: DUF2892 domain-containing protein [Lysinibacillus sp.]|nr:DUF2892 domain-containing protein [Lysinibacillus sp.]
MCNNIGTVDRVIRIILGIAILSLLLILDGNLKYLGLIGLIPLLTGIFKYCPLYSLFKVNKCQKK